MKVMMAPHIDEFNREESGIRRVVEAYFKYLPQFGIELVNRNASSYDLIAGHAASHPTPHVLHCHGLYFTADYTATNWEKAVNRDVISAARYANYITVPTAWVAEIFQRDMRINPYVIGHGIDWEKWQGETEHDHYVLWNKNRTGDVCDVLPVGKLASMFPDVRFVSTFAPPNPTGNVTTIGVRRHDEMSRIVKRAGVYLSTTKETFGIGVLEALASGVPVLGFSYGGNIDLVEHGVTGYLAQPGNYDDLAEGLKYCIQYRDQLSENARLSAKRWTWEAAAEKIVKVYQAAYADQYTPPDVSVIIPCYNYGDVVGKAIESALNQTRPPKHIVVVDDGSPDDGLTARVVEEYTKKDSRVEYHRKTNGGVATARNYGIECVDTRYICCLDADDTIAPQFLEICVEALQYDRSLALAYTGLTSMNPDGSTTLSQWPGEYDFDRQAAGHNQVPTCCVFRRDAWERLGGYNQRYAPGGCGAEDAEFWLRMGAYGMGAKKVTNLGLFMYSRTGGTSKPGYREVDWTQWHPWTKDSQHPFASMARPRDFSHKVRQYDEPAVSVIIPVGPKHRKDVLDALDSLEAQTFRKWEAILVDDTGGNINSDQKFKKAYPYVKIVVPKNHGAGAARNAGAAVARAPFLLFLDADDWLYPEAIERMVQTWEYEPGIIYTDYVGKAVIDNKEAEKLRKAGKLRQIDPKTNEAVIAHKSSDFDYNQAIDQPDRRMYIWCLITSLVPKAWHDEIGGFDEDMPSWEDWDYWIRLARAGKCFVHLREELVIYRFYTGDRRERGLQNAEKLIQYLLDKYKGNKAMPCGCRGQQRNVRPAQDLVKQPLAVNGMSGQNQANSTATTVATTMANDDNYVMVRYEHANRGQHKVIGGATNTNYGYRGGGEVFLVHKADIAAQPGLFTVVEQQPSPVPVPTKAPPPPPDMVTIKDEDGEERRVPVVAKVEVNTAEAELQKIPGITTEVARSLNAIGINTATDIVEAGVDVLKRAKGLGPARAQMIIDSASRILNGEEVKPKRGGKR